jgi:hypothetical protein
MTHHSCFNGQPRELTNCASGLKNAKKSCNQLKKTKDNTHIHNMQFYNSHKDWIIPVCQTIAFIITVIFNALASTGSLNNISTGQVSDDRPTLFTPAGYAFSMYWYCYFPITIMLYYSKISFKIYFRFHEMQFL